MLGPIDLSFLSGGFFREYNDIQPFSYRDGMTYTAELDALRAWTFRKLVPFLNENFSDMQDSWEVNVHQLTDAINAGLAAQTADNAQKIADALTAIAEADIPITDPGVLAVLNLSTTATRGWLDGHYQPKGDYQPAGAYQPAGTYLQPTTNARNGITGWFHVDEYGAIGDGTAHDEAAIQAAIDAANAAYVATGARQRVYFSPKTYLCAPSHAQNPVYALMLKSGVELFGLGTVKTAPGSYWIGTDYAILRSTDTGITDAAIRDLTFHGNRAAHNVPGGTTSAHGIILSISNGVQLVNVKVTEAAGVGIMVAGHSDNLSHSVRIEDCSVNNVSDIGIQCAQFDGLEIINNAVEWTPSNAIDIYGEPDSHAGPSTGINFVIRGNKIRNCGNGIFPETVAQGVIEDNHMYQIGDAGIHINRINAQPNNILVTGNYVYGCQVGLRGTGDCNDITVRNNHFGGFNSAGVYFGGGGSAGDSGTIAGYFVTDNTFAGNAPSTPLVVFGSGLGHIINMVILRMLTTSATSPGVVNFTSGAINSVWDTPMGPGRG